MRTGKKLPRSEPSPERSSARFMRFGPSSGDSDTLACMAGGIARAFFGGVPEVIASRVYEVLDTRLGDVTREFTAEFGCT
jgi:hypothetical protein